MFKLPGMLKQGIFGMLILFSACSPSSQDADFKSFVKTFYLAKGKQFPEFSIHPESGAAGHPLPLPNRKNLEANLRFCKQYFESLQNFDPEKLNVPLRFEYQKIKPFLSDYIRDFGQLELHRNDPTWYDLRRYFYPVPDLENMPAEQRFEAMSNLLKSVPPYFAAAMENLETPDSQKLQEALKQQAELYHLLNERTAEIIRSKNLTKDQALALDELLLRARLSVKDFIAFCRSKEFEHHDKALKMTSPQQVKDRNETAPARKEKQKN